MQDQAANARATGARTVESLRERKPPVGVLPNSAGAPERAADVAGAALRFRDYCVPYRTYARTVTEAWSASSDAEHTLIAQSG